MNKRVLLVDDEPEILASFQRQLRKDFEIRTATSGAEGLQLIDKEPVFAVVVSDYQMPEMNGFQFLKEFRRNSPDTARVMLTGQADLQVAITAINDGNLFRFLTKPTDKESMLRTLNAAVDQHRLVVSEKELLEQTLNGSVKVMTEMLGLVNPPAFGRSMRIKSCVGYMASRLQLSNQWQFELAALLSLIGYITLPPEAIRKLRDGGELSESEQKLFSKHPQVAHDLLENIPRLEHVARMISAQNNAFTRQTQQPDLQGEDLIALGGNLIRIAQAYDRHISSGETHAHALRELSEQPDLYFPDAVTILDSFASKPIDVVERKVTSDQLNIHMVLDEDVTADNGLMIATKGQEITPMMLQRLQSFADSVGINEPFRVLEKNMSA